MGRHDDTCETAGRELTSRRLRAVARRRRIRRERHTWRFVNGGLAVAVVTGWLISSLSGQAAAQAAEAEETQDATVVQADWKVDDVLADMAAEQAAKEQAEAEAAEKEAAEEAAKAEEEAEKAEQEAEEEAQAELAWVSPSNDSITSYYGMRDGRLHGGTDFANSEGSEVWAASAGTVTYVGYEEGGYGNVVYIDHGNGVETRYAHASEVLVSVGDEVEKGETIMLAGSTGNSTGPHLHFEVLIDGEKVDSLEYLQEQGVDVG